MLRNLSHGIHSVHVTVSEHCYQINLMERRSSLEAFFLHGEWAEEATAFPEWCHTTNFFNMRLDGKIQNQNVLSHYMFRGTQY